MSTVGNILGAVLGGISAVSENKKQRAFVVEAARRFEELGSPEAMEIAGLIKENPANASQYVEEMFGGWNKLYMATRERALKGNIAQQVQAIRAAGGGEAEIRDFLMPHIVAGDIEPEFAKAIAEYLPETDAPEWFEQSFLKRGRWQPESVARAVDYGKRTQDWQGAAKMLAPLWAPSTAMPPATNYTRWTNPTTGQVEMIPLPRYSDKPVALPDPGGVMKDAARSRAAIQANAKALAEGKAPTLSDKQVKAHEQIIRAAESTYGSPGTVINFPGYEAQAQQPENPENTQPWEPSEEPEEDPWD